MTGGANSWTAEIQATVKADGTVEAMGKTYWSRPMLKHAGWQVKVRVFDDGETVHVWSGHHFLCSAHPIADPGFGYPAATGDIAAEIGRRVDRKRASIVRGQAALLVELLGDTIENRSFSREASLQSLLTHAFDRVVEFFRIPLQGPVERQRHRDLKRAERREARLRLAQSIFDLPYTINGQKPSSEIDINGGERKQAADAGHCLSEVAK